MPYVILPAARRDQEPHAPKDAYSFDVDTAGLDRAFEDQRRAYHRIFSRCGLEFVAVDAHSGSMGGSASTEFMVRTNAGEDDIASCPKCGYAANTEKATCRIAPAEDGPGLAAPEKFATPGVRTIEDLEKPPYGAAGSRQLKTQPTWMKRVSCRREEATSAPVRTRTTRWISRLA